MGFLPFRYSSLGQSTRRAASELHLASCPGNLPLFPQVLILRPYALAAFGGPARSKARLCGTASASQASAEFGPIPATVKCAVLRLGHPPNETPGQHMPAGRPALPGFWITQ